MKGQRWIFVILWGTFGMSGPSDALGADLASGHEGAAPAIARFEGGKLWLTIRDAPPPAVFSAVAQETGIRFSIDDSLELPPLTLGIEGVGLERAIRELISKLPAAAGHAMVYAPSAGGEPRLVEVSIFGAGGLRTPATVYAATPGDQGAGAFVKGAARAESKLPSKTHEPAETDTDGPGREDRPSGSPPDTRDVLAAGLPAQDAVVLKQAEHQLKVIEEFSKIPGGLSALEKINSYIQERRAATGPPEMCWEDAGGE